MIYKFLFLTIATLIFTPKTILAKKFTLPVECVINEDCFIQNFVDISTKENIALDFNCNHFTYDSHKGTDIRLRDFTELNKNYVVTAAADGIVQGIRNDQDELLFLTDRNLVKGKECGNGTAIKHSDDYITQYCHLKKGSIKVKPGQIVKQGEALGYIGMSGKTEFPHLHFSVRLNNKIIDPFTGNITSEIDSSKCTKFSTENSLWLNTPEYGKATILNFFVTDKIPKPKQARFGEFRDNKINLKTAKFLVLWVNTINVFKNNEIELTIYDQEQNIIFQKRRAIDKNYSRYFFYIGDYLKNLNLKKQEYLAEAKLFHDSKLSSQETTKFLAY